MTNRIIAAVALVVIVLFILWASGCDARRALSDQKKIERGQTGAVIESGRDAMNTQANISANDAASDAQSRQNERDIRNAEGSDAAVSNDAHAAGMRALCRRKAYRDRAECRVQ